MSEGLDGRPAIKWKENNPRVLQERGKKQKTLGRGQKQKKRRKQKQKAT